MAKRKSSDGKSLERLVSLIYEAFKDIPNTQIFRNYQVPYKDVDDTGEIDVLIQTIANGENFTIAIECKDMGKAVPGSLVGAFTTKVARMKGIDKAIMVSSHGFQKAAIATAQFSGINLYTLSNVSPEIIGDWISPDSIRQITCQYVEVFDVAFQFEPNTNRHIPAAFFDLEQKIIRVNGLLYSCREFILKIESQKLGISRSQVIAHALSFAEKWIDQPTFEHIANVSYSPEPEQPVVLLYKDNKILPIVKILYRLKFGLKIQAPRSMTFQTYSDFLHKKEKAEMVVAKLNDFDLFMIQPKGQANPSMYAVDSGGTFRKLNTLIP